MISSKSLPSDLAVFSCFLGLESLVSGAGLEDIATALRGQPTYSTRSNSGWPSPRPSRSTCYGRARQSCVYTC